MSKAVRVLDNPDVATYLNALGGELSGVVGARRSYSFAVFRGDAPASSWLFRWDYAVKEVNEAIALAGGPGFRSGKAGRKDR